MALYTLPKQFSAEFASPKVKPTGAVEIDWNNPHAKGLVTAVIFQNGRVYDLVSGRDLTLNGNIKRSGNGNIFTDNGSSSNDVQVPVKSISLSEITISTNIKSSLANSFKDYWGMGQGGGTIVLESRASNSGELIPAIFSVGAGINPIGNGGNIVGELDELTTWSASRSDNTAFLQSGSTFIGSTSHTSNGDTNANDFTLLNRFSGQGRNVSAEIETLFIWERALTKEEDLSFKRDPYQILKPVVPATYFTVDGGGGTITVTEAASTLNITTQDPTIAFTGTIAIEESTSTLNLTSVDPVIDFTGLVSITESVATLNTTSIDPVIDLTATLTITESVATLNLTSVDPTITLTAANTISITEAVATLNTATQSPIITLSGTLTVVESTSTVNMLTQDPSITLGLPTYSQIFTGIEKSTEFTGTIKSYGFTGTIVQSQTFSGTTKAASFLGVTQ